jgi:beta-galactosidase
MTGLADETDRCIFGAYPGPLRDVFGLWIEETDALYPEESNQIIMQKENETYTCGFLCDRLRLEHAQALGVYGSDFYAGEPCVTENVYGNGKAYYLATQPDEAFLQMFVQKVCEEADVHPVLCVEQGIEVTSRENENGKFYFVLNHNAAEKQVTLPQGTWKNLIGPQPENGAITLGARDVAILAS